eukprot:jgi/Pico_ML_1/55745/g1390.t1
MAEEEEGLERIVAHVGRGAKAVGGAISMAGVALAKGATSAALLVTDGHARRSGLRGLARRTKRLRNASSRDSTKQLAKIYQALEKAQDRLRKRRIEVLRDDGLEDEVDVQICDRLLEMAPRADGTNESAEDDAVDSSVARSPRLAVRKDQGDERTRGDR